MVGSEKIRLEPAMIMLFVSPCKLKVSEELDFGPRLGHDKKVDILKREPARDGGVNQGLGVRG